MPNSDDIGSPVFDPPAAEGGERTVADNRREEEEAKKTRRRRQRKIAALLLIAAVIAYLIYRALGGASSLPVIGSDLPSYDSSIYGITQPMGVAVSPDGSRIYVTESSEKRLVKVFDTSGNEIDALKPPHKVGWALPVYVAVDPDNEDVYVSDRFRETIEVYNKDGEYQRDFTPSGPQGKGANPLGLAFGPEGNLYTTDVAGNQEDHRVLVFGDSEEPLRTIGQPGTFWFPNGLVVDSSGNVYVSDSNNGRLAIFDSAGTLKASIQRGVGEGDLGLPRGVAIDGDNRLFVVDTTAHAIKVYEIGDQAEVPAYVGSFGVEGFADGAFEYPNGIAIADGRIYVTDRENNRLQIWSY